MADALVRELNRLGYQPVFLPRTGVTPPELYSYSRDARRLVRHGALENFLSGASGLAPSNGKLGDIAYKYTSSKKLDLAVSFLENALRCIGIDAIPKIDLGFAGSKEFSFAFTDVTYTSVDPAVLAPILRRMSTNGLPKESVEAGFLHIAYEYAYARQLVMSRADKKDFSADINGKVGDFIDVGTKGSVTVEGRSTISFNSKDGVSIAFAYKAGRLVREGAEWVLYPEEVTKSGLTEERSPYLPQPAVVLPVEG